MEKRFPQDIEYLVFTVNQGRYGVPHFDVVSVMDIPSFTAVPHLPEDVRGVIAFRNGNIPLFDLRVCFGTKARLSETDDLVKTMELRKQDHINWLNKLKDEVLHDKPISVQTDPHKCAFGKWYDTFQSDNLNLNAYMRRFDEPHKAIHRVAVDAEKLISSSQVQSAHDLINRTEEGLLVRLLELFDGIADQVRKYLLEYAIILEIGEDMFAIAVDDINFFSRLSHIEHPLPSGVDVGSELVQALGRYHEEGNTQEKDVLLLDMSRITSLKV